MKDSGDRVCSEVESGLGSSPKIPLPDAQSLEGKHGTTCWQIYYWRSTLSKGGELPSCEAPRPPFAPLWQRAVREASCFGGKLKIAIGALMVRTDIATDGEQVSRVIRAVRAS
ncbi:hypothetical protein GCM10007857_89010 [Bradyrhizobium iriomotense]|uniref:Transposase n=1 Tax=Bradyrhizobium iriomotense TaxID=441950 RepID=A0ABQ6BHX5_9BRAD|nr:hypothetical protein GCM10007857_89010 [Bradyrhizobium iriomotense]